MEKTWIFMILFSFIVSLIKGNLDELVKALFESTNTAIQLCVGIAGIICLWSGFMKVAEKSGFIKVLSKILKPIIYLIFPEIAKNDEISGLVGMNMAANMLGLGNVATPIGIKAMEKLNECNENKKALSNSMLMFLILNTASIQLIPITVIALRTNADSEAPTSIVLPTIISSVASVVAGIVIVKIISNKEKK